MLYLKLLRLEIMKLLESTKIKKGENVAHVEITEVDK